MIEVTVNGQEQIEHTKAILPPANMQPMWKEILPFDIEKPNDEVQMIIINNYNNQKEILAVKRFRVDGVPIDDDDEEGSDPLSNLRLQHKIEDTLEIYNRDEPPN